jgi:hypothetical protein
MLDCRLISYTDSNSNEQEFSLFKVRHVSHQQTNNNYNSNYNGRLLWQASSSCHNFSWLSQGTGYIRAAQVSVLFAVIAGGIAFLVVLVETLFRRFSCSYILNTISIGISVIFSGLVFLVFKSKFCLVSGDCVISTGGAANISALLLYALAGMILCCTPKPAPVFQQVCCPNSIDQDLEVEETKNPRDTKDRASFMTVGARSRRRIQRTPSNILQEMESQTMSLGDFMEVETRADHRRVKSAPLPPPPPQRLTKSAPLSHPPPIREIEVDDGDVSLPDMLTVDPSMQSRSRRRTASAVLREMEDDNMSLSDLMSLSTSPGTYMR